MKNLLLLFLLVMYLILTLARCGEKQNPYEDLKLPDSKDYNQVIEEILNQDTIEVFKSKFISADLVKRKVDLSRGKVEIEGQNKLLNINRFLELMSLYPLCPEDDSLYFAFQNDSTEQIGIDTAVIDFAQLISSELIAENKNSNEYFGYIQFSLPVFNKALSKAYVLSDYHCKGCGHGKVYVLEKINNRWTIAHSDYNWMN